MQGALSGQQFLPLASSRRRSTPRRCVTEANQGGNHRKSGIPSNVSQNMGNSRIILPGQSQQSAAKLTVPGQHPGFKKYEQPGYKPPPPSFRPPPGFMDGPIKQADIPSDPKVLLDKLRSQAGHWHQLARFLPQLARAGFDTSAIEGETGIHRSEQDIWNTALQVYDSLQRSGEMTEEELKHFNIEQGSKLLYELRFVPTQARPEAARYMAVRDMDPTEAVTLGRSLKEHTRRSGQKEGFEYTPQDCMAFKYYRDALETRKPEDCRTCVESGLVHAQSESAIAKLKSLVEAPEEKEDLSASRLTLMRLTKEEVNWKTVAVAGSYATTTAAMIRSCPIMDEYSRFRIFKETGNAEQAWVTLPRWNLLGLAEQPCALTMPDLTKCADVARAAGIKVLDQHKLDGSGMVVFDRVVGEPDLDSHYLIEIDGSLKIVPGSALQSNSNCCGRILYVCRPPKVERLQTDEAMGPIEV